MDDDIGTRGHDRVADSLIATASPDETSQFRFSRPRNHGTSAGAAGDKPCVGRTTRLWQPSRQRQRDVDKQRRTHVLAVGSGAWLHDTASNHGSVGRRRRNTGRRGISRSNTRLSSSSYTAAMSSMSVGQVSVWQRVEDDSKDRK